MGALYTCLFRDVHVTAYSVALENETQTCVKTNQREPAIKLMIGNTQIPFLSATQNIQPIVLQPQ